MNDVKVIADEEIAQELRLVVGVLCIESPREAEKKFVPRRGVRPEVEKRAYRFDLTDPV